ncbi:hypothetical protein DPMN_139431 [Dreissena polymorpha]|uniref:Uncharacterized protein n=1 Tax=Dreissena polymorpha TaxID=45954 RepID=A0A9D4G912_DREPO|nr:hypothetical protein DPMN_139431 [Dreissena polymorpha]
MWTLSSPFPGKNQYFGVCGGDMRLLPRVGSEPTKFRSLGGHLIHYTTATLLLPMCQTRGLDFEM